HTRSKRDWSSDVCSSDLPVPHQHRRREALRRGGFWPGGGLRALQAPRFRPVARGGRGGAPSSTGAGGGARETWTHHVGSDGPRKIGRASCRERGESVVGE